MATYKPRFKEVYVKANEFLVASHSILTFPFSTIKFVKELADISFCSFEKARSMGLEPMNFGSDSAFLTRQNGKHIIFFNQNNIKPRIQFSILHELGHFIFEHDYDTKDEKLYGVQEVETNYFAAQLLMPEQILRELTKREVYVDSQFLMKYFSVSSEAANKRINTLDKIKDFNKSKEEVAYDDLILMKYQGFVDSIKKPIISFDDELALEEERQKWLYSYTKYF